MCSMSKEHTKNIDPLNAMYYGPDGPREAKIECSMSKRHSNYFDLLGTKQHGSNGLKEATASRRMDRVTRDSLRECQAKQSGVAMNWLAGAVRILHRQQRQQRHEPLHRPGCQHCPLRQPCVAGGS